MSRFLSKHRNIDRTFYLSGQIGYDADGKTLPEGIEAQTHNVFAHIKETLASAGLSLADVVSCNCYLVDRNDFPAFNDVYLSYFFAPLPARTTVVCTMVTPSARIEISVIAEKKPQAPR